MGSKKETFPSLLKKWRAAHGLSQSEAAKAIAVSLKTLQDWEQERQTPKGPRMEQVMMRMKLELH